MTDDLFTRLAQNLLDARSNHALTVGSTVITYKFDIQRSMKHPKTIEEIESKLTEIFTKNPEPSLGLIEGLFGIRILNVGNGSLPQAEECDDFADEFAMKRLMSNEQELEFWVLDNLKRFPQEAQQMIISYEFQKAIFKKAKQSKQQGE